MTTTENTSAHRSITLPLDEILFLLNLADTTASDDTKVSPAEFERLESLRGVVQDTDMPLDGFPEAPQVYILSRVTDPYSPVQVRAFADEAEALKIMKLLNEFSSDRFEVESITFEP